MLVRGLWFVKAAPGEHTDSLFSYLPGYLLKMRSNVLGFMSNNPATDL